jgi:hypothetical protein
VVDATFGVGPNTPCYLSAKARTLAGTAVSAGQKLIDLACPPNYFLFDAKVTFKQGGFTSASAHSGVGIRFDGTLSLLGLVKLTSVQADISTSPFNFHFANNPIDVSIDVGIALTARIGISGDIGASGFDLALEGSVSVMGQSIASASGVISTKGMGVCGGVAGASVGFGEKWGEAPAFFASGCTTSQYRVT